MLLLLRYDEIVPAATSGKHFGVLQLEIALYCAATHSIAAIAHGTHTHHTTGLSAAHSYAQARHSA
jgi:hypothetical protein